MSSRVPLKRISQLGIPFTNRDSDEYADANAIQKRIQASREQKKPKKSSLLMVYLGGIELGGIGEPMLLSNISEAGTVSFLTFAEGNGLGRLNFTELEAVQGETERRCVIVVFHGIEIKL
jgi:hypothetical protein